LGYVILYVTVCVCRRKTHLVKLSSSSSPFNCSPQTG